MLNSEIEMVNKSKLVMEEKYNKLSHDNSGSDEEKKQLEKKLMKAESSLEMQELNLSKKMEEMEKYYKKLQEQNTNSLGVELENLKKNL